MEKFIIYIFFLSFIIYPFTYYEFKIPVLAWFILTIMVKIILKSKIDLTINVFGLFFIYVFTGCFYIFYGILLQQNHPESLPFLIALYVAYPVIYFFILSGIPKKKYIINVSEKIFSYGIVGVSIVLILAYYNKNFGLPDFLKFTIESIWVDLRTTKGVVKTNYNGISSLLFLFPFLFTRLIIRDSDEEERAFFWRIIVLLIGFTGVFLTGRRALIILCLFSIVLAFIFKYFAENRNVIKQKHLKIGVVFLLIIIPIFLVIDKKSISKAISSTISYALNFSVDSSSDSERTKQINSFFSYIVKKPVLGYGHGAYMKEVIRSEEKPWRYEITYLDIIFHTGIIGLILYAIGPIWIFISLLLIAQKRPRYRSHSFALINALLCVLIAFGTNPYLNALDIQWVIYYPILFIMIVNKINID